MEETSLKTRYFRRKQNCAAVEWIEMSGTEYLDFVRDPENKDRFFLNMKNVVLECSKEEYLRNRAEKRRSDYLAEGKKDWTIISLFAQKDKETSGEEVIPDLETDVEEEIIHTARGHHLRGQSVSGPLDRELHPCRFARRKIGTFYGADSADKGDERCRHTSRANRQACSPQILLLGECSRLLQLRLAARGGFPDCPGGNC